MSNEWITVKDAAQEFGVSQTYIQFLCSGRKRVKGKAMWHELPKIKNLQLTISEKQRPKFLIDYNEIKTIFTNRNKQNGNY